MAIVKTEANGHVTLFDTDTERGTVQSESDAATADTPPARSPSKSTPLPSVSRRGLRLGLRGGIVATVVMTVFRVPISNSPPPTAWLWSEYVAGGEPEAHPLAGLVLHLLYGTAGGALFGAVLADRVAGIEVERETTATLWGLAYGLLLSKVGATVLLERVLSMDLEPDERFVFHLSHVIYGLSLGAWFGSNA